MDARTLVSDFPRATRDDWLKAVGKALGEAPFQSLRTPLHEGFATEPLYTGTSSDAPIDRRGARAWQVIQLVDQANPAVARQYLADDLANGCGGFWLQLGGNVPYGGGVLGAQTSAEMADLIALLSETDARIYISGGADALGGAAVLVAASARLGWGPDRPCGSAGLDPLTVIAASGELPAARDEVLADGVDAAHYVIVHNMRLRVFLASGRAWHQAGGSAVEELGFTLAAAVSYWRALANSGVPADRAAGLIDFVHAADTDLFLTIAKFRAARLLWARALEAAGVSASQSEFIAEMSYRVLTERDPNVNILRGTAAAFGAGIGGADGVLVLPYDAASGETASFARRLARNTSHILQHESHLHEVSDAAAGSAYVDDLTSRLCAASWELFREVEASGGLLDYLAAGRAAARLAGPRAAREAAVAKRKQRITGVSAYPDLSESLDGTSPDATVFEPDVFVADSSAPPPPRASRGERFAALVAAAAAGASIDDLERACRTVYEPAAPVAVLGLRAAEPFEELRRASDAALVRVGSRPPVFLALLGSPEDYRSRAAWAQSFFATGGVQAIVPDTGFTRLDDLVAAFRASPAPVACLCSSDRGYAALPGAVRALREANAMFIYLAGPSSALASLAADDRRGVDRIVYEGCDAARLLGELHQILRVEDMGQMAFDEDDIVDEG